MQAVLCMQLSFLYLLYGAPALCKHFGAGRGALAGCTKPAHTVQLEGCLASQLAPWCAGDHGFDPLRLADDAENRRWMVHSEIFHGRVAMTGVAGILFTSLAHAAGQDIPEWFDAGKVYLERNPDVSFGALVYTTLILSGWAEAKRWQDWLKPGSQADGSFLGITGAQGRWRAVAGNGGEGGGQAGGREGRGSAERG